jgi:hypothetical protein
MKTSPRFFLPLLGLFHYVQVAQSTQLFFNEDGSDSPLGRAICLLIPCVDPALGARNFLAPILGGPPDGKAGEDAASTQTAETVVLTELANIAGRIFYTVLDQQLQQGANGGDIAGQTIVDVNDESASQQLRDVAYGVVNGLIDQMQTRYIGGTSSTETGDLAIPPISDTTTDPTAAATTTTTSTSAALLDFIDGEAVSERVRQVALSLVTTLFDRLADDETANGGVRRQLRGVTSTSGVPLTENFRMV